MRCESGQDGSPNPMTAGNYHASPTVLGVRGRFWTAPSPRRCERVAAQAFDAEGRALGRAPG
jgi:hypothetical protein